MAAGRLADLVMRHPKVIIAVFSVGMANHDRGDKFLAYCKLPGLAEYALSDSASRSSLTFRSSRIITGFQAFSEGYSCRSTPIVAVPVASRKIIYKN